MPGYGFYGLYWDPTMLLLIPGILLAMWAQSRVKGTFKKYAGVPSRRGWSGAVAARQILDKAGLEDVSVERAHGHLSDHYDPKRKAVCLSDSVFSSSSLSALGVAAHEAGHAMQHAERYAPIGLRNAVAPIARIGSYAAWPLLILGMVLALPVLINLGIVVFSAAVVFQFLTLPVEYNASSRALAVLEEGNYLDADEIPQTKKVLSAAAMTYLASALMAVLQLARLLLLTRSNRRRRY